MHYSIVRNDENVAVTVIRPGEAPLVAGTGHPNLDAILEGVVAGDDSVIDLFDVAATVASKFESLSERVSVAHNRLYFDGEEQDNALANQVVRFISEGVEDYKPLVKFFENVQTNPNEHSRTQLYDWLNAHDFTITDEGLIVGYKGVRSSDGENFESVFSGRALVNGEVKEGHIPQKVGDVVTMPRSEVMHDPAAACHAGLHVGTFNYASDYNQGAMLEVHVNPRDVVSVPTDASGEKVRVCRYTVVGTLDAPYATAYLVTDELDRFENDEWGDGEDDFSAVEDEAQESLVDPTEFGGAQPDDAVAASDESSQAPDAPGRNVTVNVGDVYETTDKRRAGTTFKVESIEGDEAVGKSLPRNLTRKVALDRLTSYRYKKV